MTATIHDAVLDDAATPEQADAVDQPADAQPEPSSGDASASRICKRRLLGHALTFAVLPALALAMAIGASYLKWQDTSARESLVAATQSVNAAAEDTVKMLSYRPETVEKDLNVASDRLTGTFRDAYTRLINDVVIPGAKQKRVSAVANVPAAASVSATENHAVALVFVNQITTIGDDPPSSTASSVRITLDKVNGRWLISQFDPI